MKILFFANTDSVLYLFYLRLMKKLVALGWDVYAVSLPGEYTETICQSGIKHIAINFNRKSLNPFKDINLTKQLYKILRIVKPDVLHNITIKPNIYGNFAGRLAGVKIIVNSVAGLGSVFASNEKIAAKILCFFVCFLYKFAFIFSRQIIFQNNDDYNLFVNNKIVSMAKAIIIKGVGVNVDYFNNGKITHNELEKIKDEINICKDKIVVTMVARALWDKGIKEYIEAAKLLLKKNQNIIFILVGGLDTGNPSCVPIEYLQQNNIFVKWLGQRNDMKNIYKISDIVVLPSYREGLPTAILEAMAMEKPVVTTNCPGCKDLVFENKTGFLVPIKNISELAAKIQLLLNDNNLRENFGKAGREKVVKEFSDKIIIGKTIDIYTKLMRF